MTKYRFFLLISLIAILLWSGINPPAGYADWFLENIPIIAAIIGFIAFRKYLNFSDVSYTLIAIYLVFPIIASHYGVAGVGIGKIIGQWLDTTRNMYDRLTHFMFGFLSFLPLRDIVLNASNRKNFFNMYFLPIWSIISLSALYEIFEWLAAITVNPALAASFYASQGDIFDTPKDMANAIVGALVAAALVFIYRYFKDKRKLEKHGVLSA